MSYVQNNLLKDEQVLLKGELSGLRWVAPIILAIVFLFLTMGIGSIILLLITYIRGTKTEIAITNKRIIGRTGLFSTQTLELKLDKVESIMVKTSIWGYGEIIIHGVGSTNMRFPCIANAEQFKKKFQEISHA